MRNLLRSGVLLAIIALTVVGRASAQAPRKFYTYVDTVGIAAVAPDTYVTWVYAKAGPTTWPSSAVLVAFDCRERKVQRVAHIVFKMRADSAGVWGAVVEDEGGWVDVSVPATYELVCRVGAQHPYQQPSAHHDRQGAQPPFGQPWPRA